MKYIVRDANSILQVIEAVGFVPEGVVCEAPANSEPQDGHAIDLIDGAAVLNLDRKQALDTAEAAAKDAARLLEIQKMNKLKALLEGDS